MLAQNEHGVNYGNFILTPKSVVIIHSRPLSLSKGNRFRQAQPTGGVNGYKRKDP